MNFEGSLDYRDAAVAAIAREHRALTQVVELLRHLMRELQAGYIEPDFRLLSLALYYMDEFPGKLHHSKEDAYMFPALRRHAPEQPQALDDLARDHLRDRQQVANLHRLLVFYQAAAPGALVSLRDALERYAGNLYDHMAREEALLAAAHDRLPDEAWRAISDAFARNEDPIFGEQRRREFAVLHHRIMNLLPRKIRKAVLPGEAQLEEGP